MATGSSGRSIALSARLTRALAGGAAEGAADDDPERDPERDAVAVLFLDLDGFEAVVDRLGNDAGDCLLAAVGQPPAAAERVIAALRPPIRVDDAQTPVSTSIGVALGRPGQARSADLLRAADIALYQAKAAGRGTYRLFRPGLAALLRRDGRRTRLPGP